MTSQRRTAPQSQTLTTRVLILVALDEHAAYGPDTDVPLREIHAFLANGDSAPQYTAPDAFNEERKDIQRHHVYPMHNQGLIESEGRGNHWYLLPAGRDVLSALRG